MCPKTYSYFLSTPGKYGINSAVTLVTEFVFFNNELIVKIISSSNSILSGC